MPGAEKKDENEDVFTDPFEALYELGLAIFADDAQDFPEIIQAKEGITEPGRFGILKGMQFSGMPPHPHHWIFGALIMAGSAVGKVLYALDCSRQLNEAVVHPQPQP